MKLPSKNVILFNAAAGVLMLFGIGAVVQSFLAPKEAERCLARYHTGTLFSITGSDGAPLPPAVMQGQLGGTEWGATQNLRVEAVADAPAGVAMRIALPKSAPDYGSGELPNSGIGFQWKVGFLENATSACLGYDVWMPASFDFGFGGRLPGLLGDDQQVAAIAAAPNRGNSTGGAAQPQTRFATPFMWRRSGRGGIIAKTAGVDGSVALGADFMIPRGRWVKIEQEVILNTPGKKDGELRVWLDGELKMTRSNMAYRTSAAGRIIGVVADTHYDGRESRIGAPADTALLVTPFELRWQ